jgi:hypothetical protein
MILGLDGVADSLYNAAHGAELDGEKHHAAIAKTTELARPSHLVEMLRLLRDSRQAAAGCARQSYRHPLGFHALMLIDGTPEFDLRLHAWWPARQPGADHVHDHRFAFASTIVRGGYEMQIFRPDPVGTPMLEYSESGGAREGWELRPVGPARLSLLTTLTLETGSSYALRADTLHRVSVPPGRLCVTLLLRTALNATRPTTRVFARPGDKVAALAPLRTMTSNEYRWHLGALIRELTD